MKNYKIKKSKKWDYENGFYLTSPVNRIGKMLCHFEIYKQIIDIPGDVMEFGVYKGASFIRFLTFRKLMETETKRKIIGFDVFGKFPNTTNSPKDRTFIDNFEKAGGYGIRKSELSKHILKKGFTNFTLVKGDIINTLPTYLNRHKDTKIALLHLDVDTYEPTKLILELLWHSIAPGGILLLDNYNITEGETKAVDEFFKDKNVFYQKTKYHSKPFYIIKD